MAALAWPYVYVYRLDNAVAARDMTALAELVDLEAVRNGVKKSLQKEVDSAVGTEGGRIVRWLKQGAKAISDSAVDASVDLEWVADTLSEKPGDPPTVRASLWSDMDYAFYESLSSFIIRLGPLEDDPMHVRLRLDGQAWRVVAIYGP